MPEEQKTGSIPALAVARCDTPTLRMSAYSGVWQLDLIQLPPAAMLSFSAPSRIFVGVTNDIPATVDAGQDRLTMTREGEVLVVKVTRDLTQEIINAKFHLESFDDLIQQLF